MVLDMAAVGRELAMKPGVAKIRSSQLSATGAASAYEWYYVTRNREQLQ